MNKYLMIWPKSEEIVHINYHYTQFGECVDYLKKYFPEEIIAVDCDIENKNIMKLIQEKQIEKIIMQVNYENAKNAFKMANNIKEKHDIPILAYGSITVMHPKLFANSKFDAIYRNGDAEVCIKSFLRHYNKNASIEEIRSKIKGARLIQNCQFYNTQNGEYISPDNWGISKQEDVPVEEYDKKKGKNRFVMNISRGCPFGCTHCLIQLTEGRRERRRSIENVRESLKGIQEKYKHIKIWAANFTLDKKYVAEFCEMMQNDYPQITWECATRIDLVRDEELLKQMQKSGCRQISLGIESLNNEELIQTKEFKKEEINTAISNIQNNGMQVKGCIMLGMPNQTKREVKDTLKFLKDRNVLIRPTIYTPYHKILDGINVDELSQYNRKTYKNTNIRGVTHNQLLELVKNPYDYERILQEREYGER